MKFILASQSPRRREILENLNMPFVIKGSSINEIISESQDPKISAMALAFMKGIEVSSEYDDHTIIAADTIVVLENKVLGKPSSPEAAFHMLTSLSGKVHQVITGIALINLSKGIKVVDYVSTDVTFEVISEETIRRYIQTEEPLDKAGAYGIQGFGSLFVKEILGDYYNVVGLPVNKLNHLLKQHFNYSII